MKKLVFIIVLTTSCKTSPSLHLDTTIQQRLSNLESNTIEGINKIKHGNALKDSMYENAIRAYQNEISGDTKLENHFFKVAEQYRLHYNKFVDTIQHWKGK